MKDSEVHHLTEALCDGSHSESKSRQRTLSCLSMEYFTGVSVCMVFFFLHDRELRQIHHETK